MKPRSPSVLVPVTRFLRLAIRCSPLRGLRLFLLCPLAFSAPAATLWNGPSLAYTQPAHDPTQPANQDHVTAGVWLTRAASGGLFNAVTETAADTNSPADTEWAFGTLDRFASLTYTNWLAWLNGQSPVTLVGQPVVVHLIAEDIYLALQFTFWGSHGTGGFAYQRSTPPTTLLGPASVTAHQFSLSYTASPGLTYVVQVSTNLTNWTAIATNLATSNPAPFSEPAMPTGARFYRVVRVPNP